MFGPLVNVAVIFGQPDKKRGAERLVLLNAQRWVYTTIDGYEAEPRLSVR